MERLSCAVPRILEANIGNYVLNSRGDEIKIPLRLTQMHDHEVVHDRMEHQ